MDNAQISAPTICQAADTIIAAQGLSKIYGGKRPVTAVNNVSFTVKRGEIFGLIGPDGAGKTSIMQMLAGVATASGGTMQVAGLDPQRQSNAIKDIIGYMPQGIGLNLYDSLSVKENIRFFRDLRQIPEEIFAPNSKKMLNMTRLTPFLTRQAKNLSGGMRQKLSLICTLVHLPDILFLDEPTTGVDPRSRLEFWQIILDLVEERHATVILSTSYMDEAARCHRVALMHEGEIIQQGTPQELLSLLTGEMISCVAEPQYSALSHLQNWDGAIAPQVFDQRIRMRLVSDIPSLSAYLTAGGISCREITKAPPTLDDVFVQLSGKEINTAPMPFITSSTRANKESMVKCQNVTIRFGDFTAVNDISCTVQSGEVFGLLGPNGAGKTTLLKSMCGLLQPSSGSLFIAGFDVDSQRSQVWSQIGYMSQRFSLYQDLTVKENLQLYSGLYQVKDIRYDQILEAIGLATQYNQLAGRLPIGIRQRLSLICAILHNPAVVFLDEPTSGVDPTARRYFWNVIHQLTREMGKTVLVSTHYMDEAERCDRLILMDKGKLVALDRPEILKQQAAAAYGQLLVITAVDPSKTCELIKPIFPSVAMFGQDIHLRSLTPEHDIRRLSEILTASGMKHFPITSGLPSMEETFMDFISSGDVHHV